MRRAERVGTAATAMVAENDRRLVETLHGLTTLEWSAPSLCGAWTNHQVLAHLVGGYRTTVDEFARAFVRHRGSFDRANAALAVEFAARWEPEALLEEFDRLRTAPRGIGRLLPARLMLGDHVVHELDILRSLGRRPAVPTTTATAILATEVAIPNPFVPARRNARGLSLRATDAEWSHGDPAGPLTVEGEALDLVLALAGRPEPFDRLRGAGVATLRERLDPPVLLA